MHTIYNSVGVAISCLVNDGPLDLKIVFICGASLSALVLEDRNSIRLQIRHIKTVRDRQSIYPVGIRWIFDDIHSNSQGWRYLLVLLDRLIVTRWLKLEGNSATKLEHMYSISHVRSSILRY